MKYQQVSVDFVNMLFTAVTYCALAGAAWIFLRLLQACFWLPKHLKKQTDIRQMLQDKVDGYEKYIEECERKEKEAAEAYNNSDLLLDDELMDEGGEVSVEKPAPIDEKKWKERRECLEMLKKELRKVRDGGDLYDWDSLLDDDKDEETEENESGKGKLNSASDSDGKEEDDEEVTSKESLNDKSSLNECEESEIKLVEKENEGKKYK